MKMCRVCGRERNDVLFFFIFSHYFCNFCLYCTGIKLLGQLLKHLFLFCVCTNAVSKQMPTKHRAVTSRQTPFFRVQRILSHRVSQLLRVTSRAACVGPFLSRRPCTDADIREADKSITSYMSYFRKYFPDTRILPKQHILEHHCIDFMKTWHFGLALHGEQGGEETHAFITELKVHVRGVNNEENKIQVLMTEHFMAVSPVLRSVLQSTSKKRKIEDIYSKDLFCLLFIFVCLFSF